MKVHWTSSHRAQCRTPYLGAPKSIIGSMPIAVGGMNPPSRLRAQLDFSWVIGETNRLSRDHAQCRKKRDEMDNAHHAANRANWDERAESHLLAYGTDEFVAEPTAMSPVVLDDLALMAPFLPHGSVAGLRLVHPQCCIGTDTLSWARLGRMSPPSIFRASRLSPRGILPLVLGLMPCVIGHAKLPIRGHGTAYWRPAELPVGGHEICPLPVLSPTA